MAIGKSDFFGEVERFQMAKTVAGRALYAVSVYRLGDVLIDSGGSSARAAFLPWMRAKPVRTMLTTHEHEDHIGNHSVLPRECVVYAPKLAREFLEHGHPRFPLYRRLVWGYHEPAPGAKLVGDKVDAGGRAFRVIETNGHSRDHVAYLDERENALYSGDAYMGKYRFARLAEDVITSIATLRKMAEIDPAILFPAHNAVIPRPRARLLDTAEHFEAIWRRVWQLHDRGLDARAIRKEMWPREPWLTWYSSGEFSCDNMVVNLLRARPR